MRVAIAAESFLPHVNGVSGSVVRPPQIFVQPVSVLRLLRRSGHSGMRGMHERVSVVLRTVRLRLPRLVGVRVGLASPSRQAH